MAKKKSPFEKEYKNYHCFDRRLIDLFWGGNLRINKDIVASKLQNIQFDKTNQIHNAFCTAYSSIDWDSCNGKWYFPIDINIVPEFRSFCCKVFDVSVEEVHNIEKEEF